MTVNVERIRECIQNFDFSALFVEELGWDRHAMHLDVSTDERDFRLNCVAQKRGLYVLQCAVSDGEPFPLSALRRKVERQVAKSAHEHIIIYTDPDNTQQIWQWAKREIGRPIRCPEHEFRAGQSGESLVQKVRQLTVSIEEEEEITLVDMTSRVRAAFDVDRLTRRFYERFKNEHGAFLEFIEGVQNQADRDWYASLMLNRLMFVYFIQKKGFLDGDVNYLRKRLEQSRERMGKDKFHSFYRYFLLRLFHEGLGQRASERAEELDDLLGKVPYLNGGLFDVHELERDNPDIQIADDAFERLFNFFDEYQWHLDDRLLRNDNEINPDVLGYIFEKYINQKQMGAYYTKEDITEYIAKNTIIPFLFDAAQKKCAIAFQPNGALWQLLRDNPERYIYDAVGHGMFVNVHTGQRLQTSVPLPKNISIGLKDVAKRGDWNRSAPPELALPTETWREHVARRQRCQALRKKLAKGEIADINDLITDNLNIHQFAEDVITNCEGPETLRAFYHAIENVSVLDPACGSGAFLFAALNILQPLYEACLDRMQEFLDDLQRSDESPHPKKFSDFRKILKQIDDHPNREYFILKSIIINNLYGVDIMPEAVEICKLRLFLKLVSQVETANHLEPLPDIDFNIRAGNTLVGFTSLEQIRQAAEKERTGQKRLVFTELDDEIRRIEEEADIVDRKFKMFRLQQTELGGAVTAEDKADLRESLQNLTDELDRYLAREYGVDPDKPQEFQLWLDSHLPFHWFADFYGMKSSGGFGVVIGNPPYIEYSKVRRQYRVNGLTAIACGNLYAPFTERSLQLLSQDGRFAFIVQAPIVSTQRMAEARHVLKNMSDQVWFSTYDDRPSKLFDGMHHSRLAIILSRRKESDATRIATTKYHKWYKQERPILFQTLAYLVLPSGFSSDVIPKFRSDVELSVYEKVSRCPKCLGDLMSPSPTKHKIYYKITGVGHWFTFTLKPPKFWRDGEEGSSTREKTAEFRSRILRDTTYCCLCSTLHYWIYQARTNCRDFNPSDLRYLPVPERIGAGVQQFQTLAKNVMKRLEETSDVGSGTYAVGGNVQYQRFKPKTAKALLDEIDTLLAEFYGFTAGELDFIVNYDVKYRLGRDPDD